MSRTGQAWARRYPSRAELHLPYDDLGREALKAAIPHTARTWTPSRKCWVVEEPFVDRALKIAQVYFGRVTIDDQRPKQQPKPAASVATLDWAEALREALPEPLRQPVYKALVRIVHPDVGGDARLAQQLNDAFTDRKAS